jgi:hypothetical protein
MDGRSLGRVDGGMTRVGVTGGRNRDVVDSVGCDTGGQVTVGLGWGVPVRSCFPVAYSEGGPCV